MMDLLASDHPALRASAALHARAWREILERGLAAGASTRAIVDAPRLEEAIGRTRLIAAFPSLEAGHGAVAMTGGWLCEDPLDAARGALLASLLALDADRWPQLPLFFVDPLTIRDAAGRVVLHAADDGDVLLFSLPEHDLAALRDALRAASIPDNAIERVEVDGSQLGP